MWDFASTNRCITTSTTVHHGTKHHVGWSNMIWMDFWIFYTSYREGVALDGIGGPRFYHNFPVGDEWLWARETKGVRLFYFWGAGGCIHGVHSGTLWWFFSFGHVFVLGGLILFSFEMYSVIMCGIVYLPSTTYYLLLSFFLSSLFTSSSLTPIA